MNFMMFMIVLLLVPLQFLRFIIKIQDVKEKYGNITLLIISMYKVLFHLLI